MGGRSRRVQGRCLPDQDPVGERLEGTGTAGDAQGGAGKQAEGGGSPLPTPGPTNHSRASPAWRRRRPGAEHGQTQVTGPAACPDRARHGVHATCWGCTRPVQDLLKGVQPEHARGEGPPPVVVAGGLAEVDLAARLQSFCYWPGPRKRVLRATWFVEKAPGDWAPLKVGGGGRHFLYVSAGVDDGAARGNTGRIDLRATHCGSGRLPASAATLKLTMAAGRAPPAGSAVSTPALFPASHPGKPGGSAGRVLQTGGVAPSGRLAHERQCARRAGELQNRRRRRWRRRRGRK